MAISHFPAVVSTQPAADSPIVTTVHGQKSLAIFDKIQQDLLIAMLVQYKINNSYLAMITGEVITESDLEG